MLLKVSCLSNYYIILYYIILYYIILYYIILYYIILYYIILYTHISLYAVNEEVEQQRLQIRNKSQGKYVSNCSRPLLLLS